jgi:hypothetical protein
MFCSDGLFFDRLADEKNLIEPEDMPPLTAQSSQTRPPKKAFFAV